MTRPPGPVAGLLAVLAAGPALAQVAPATPNAGSFILPVMCDTDQNYRRLVELANASSVDPRIIQEFDALTQRNCTIPPFGSGYVILEEKDDLARIELRVIQNNRFVIAGTYWLSRAHLDRFRCQAVMLNTRGC